MRAAVLLDQALAPVPGGTGRYALGLAAALARTASAGDEVHGVVAWRRDTAAARVPGVRGPRRLGLPHRPLVLAWQAPALRRIAPAPRRADVVHAPTLLLPPRRGRPLVVTIHDAVPWTHPETLTPRGVAWHLAMADRAAQEADAIVVPTAAVGEALRQVLPQVQPARLHVVGQGATAALSPAARAAPVDRADLPERYLLSLATLEPRKGLDVLLEALAQPGAPDLPLLVVGQAGWGDVDVPARAAQLGIADRVKALGRVPDEQLSGILAGATALVMPSRAEGFGLPVLEAMAAGVPAVTSDDPALVEVGGGATAVARRDDPADLAQQLARVCGDEQLRASMSSAGLARARDFDWDACARRLWQLYAGLAGGPG